MDKALIVSVIIPTFSRPARLARVLQSVRNQDIDDFQECCVV